MGTIWHLINLLYFVKSINFGTKSILRSTGSVIAKKMRFFIKDFFSKCDETRSFLRTWSNLLEKSLMENFIFCAWVSIDLTMLFATNFSIHHIILESSCIFDYLITFWRDSNSKDWNSDLSQLTQEHVREGFSTNGSEILKESIFQLQSISEKACPDGVALTLIYKCQNGNWDYSQAAGRTSKCH